MLVRASHWVSATYLPGGVVRNADVADLALVHQVVEGAKRFLHRRPRVGPMELVEIDPIGPQALQARLDGTHDVVPRSEALTRRLAQARGKLGGENQVLATRPEDLSEHVFGIAVAIDIRRVEQIDAEVERLVHHRARRFEGDPPAEIVAAETDRRNAQAGPAEVP